MAGNALHFMQMLHSTQHLLDLIINVLRVFHVVLIKCCAGDIFFEPEKYFIIGFCYIYTCPCLHGVGLNYA
jgi:hypothetical protein